MFLCAVLNITYQVVLCLLVGWALGVIETAIAAIIHDELRRKDMEHRLAYAFSLMDLAINAGYVVGALLTGWMQISHVNFGKQMFWSSWIEFIMAILLVYIFRDQMFSRKKEEEKDLPLPLYENRSMSVGRVPSTRALIMVDIYE